VTNVSGAAKQYNNSLTLEKETDMNKNFKNQVITDRIFFHQDLSDADFSGAVLKNVRFNTCNLKGANFNNATLNNVNLWYTYVAYATFANAVLNQVHGLYVDFTGVDFLTADVNNAFIWVGKFDGAKAKPEAGFRTKKGGDTPRYKVPVISLAEMRANGYQH
jgi:uncharacterized protein YjbI with pentapeptide repeats